MGFSVVEHLIAQVAIGGMELEERLTQVPLVVGYRDELAAVFPKADLGQREVIQHGMVVHVLPGRLQPVAVQIAGPVVRD